MPQVPYSAVPTVTPGPAPDVYQRINATPAAFGAGVGETLSGVGSLLLQRGLQQRNEDDAALAKNALVSAAIKQGDIESAYYEKAGINAKVAYPDFVKSMEQLRKEALDALPNDASKKLFDSAFTNRAVFSINDASKHAASEGKKYVVGESGARVDLALKDSASKFNDDGLFNHNLGTINAEIDNQAKLMGWSPEQTELTKATTLSKAWGLRIQQMAVSDPWGAKKAFDLHKDDLTSEDTAIIGPRIDTAIKSKGVDSLTSAIMSGGKGVARPGVVGAISGRSIDVSRTADMRHISPAAAALYNSIKDVPGAVITSGFASSGHVEHSQHYNGNAFDVNVSKMSDAQKADFLQKAIAGGARGIGIYPSGNSIHIDTRATPTAWGWSPRGVYRGADLSSAPAWARDILISSFGGGKGGGAAPGGIAGRVFGAETSYGANIRVSPKGAMGPMQVMPDTARMVARTLGIPFSLDRLQHDFDYGMQIGQTYLNMMTQRYGSETLAVAAYNAGPGAVDKWLQTIGDPRKGGISEAEWAAKIPYAETRNYVGQVMGGSGTPPPSNAVLTAGKGGASLSELIAQADATANTYMPGDSDFADKLRDSVTASFNQVKAVAADTEARNYDAVLSAAIPDTGTKPISLEELWSAPGIREAYLALDATKRDAIQSQLKQNASPETAATPEVLAHYAELRGMHQTKPDEFRLYDIANDTNLTIQMKKDLIELQTSTVNAPKTVDLTEALGTVRPSILAAGLDPNADTGSDDAKRYNKFVGVFSQAMNRAVETKKGTPLTDQEKRDIAENLLKEVTFEGPSSFFGLFGTGVRFGGSKETKSVFETPNPLAIPSFEDSPSALFTGPTEPMISSATRQTIIDRFTTAKGRSPTNAEIVFLWNQLRKTPPTIEVIKK